MTHDRHIPLDGASNFRDFGGYPTADGRQVKWRRLYRSDRLSELSDGDHARLAPLGIRQVWDLRRQSEADAAPTRWAVEGAPRLIRHPMFVDHADGPSTFERIAVSDAARHDAAMARAIMGQLYARLVGEPGPLAALKVMFEHLAEPDGAPVLYHCSAGKDRTGVTCALILAALGVDRADIDADFMLTQRYYGSDEARKLRIAQIVEEAGLGFWSEEALVPIFTVEQAYLDTALGLVDEAGGIERFLAERVGVAPAVVDRLRAALVA